MEHTKTAVRGVSNVTDPIEKQRLIDRREASKNNRYRAADLAFDDNDPVCMHMANGDEELDNNLMSFTKGLPHNYQTGLLSDPEDFQKFIKGINTGAPQDFEDTPLGPSDRIWRSQKAKDHHKQKMDVRAWESAGAGHTFDLQGPDAQAVSMPAAPKLGSDELTAEIAEVYAQALLRDIPFTVFYDRARARRKDIRKAQDVIDALNKLNWFKGGHRYGNQAPLTLETAFRGFTEGDLIGPYISQFLLAGNNGLDNRNDPTKEFDASDGYINYGALTIDQRVRKAREGKNFMTNWDDYYDVQNAIDFTRLEEYVGNARRFITTGRDIATYVHYDALYEAYLNACLLLLSCKAKFDVGVPFKDADHIDHQQGFAHYGGPHILTLVTEVATRALKAVRFQKFNIHRRLRPEALAARFEKIQQIKPLLDQNTAQILQTSFDDLEMSGIFNHLRHENECNLLLPMAFCEGSPMHPSYGAGHATVAGACVTILKAFFDHKQHLQISEDGDSFGVIAATQASNKAFAFVPNNSGRSLRTVETEPLTLGNELNKLAANISVGRDWAGVHYYSDYKESMLMGEEIAIGMLKEQSIMYNPLEDFYLTLPKFDGTTVKIQNGQVTPI